MTQSENCAVGIICAMQIELDRIKAALGDAHSETVGSIEFTVGTLHRRKVVCAVCGVGKVFAAMCAQTMILRYHPECIINSGVAGGLAEGLGVLDTVIADSVVQHDMDTSPLGDPVGMISGINRVQLPADPALIAEFDAVCKTQGVQHLVGIIATGDQFIASDAKRRWIVETFGAVTGEMESGAVAQVAYINQCPYAILRVISDEADGAATVDFPTFVRAAAKTSSEIVLAWLARRSA